MVNNEGKFLGDSEFGRSAISFALAYTYVYKHSWSHVLYSEIQLILRFGNNYCTKSNQKMKMNGGKFNGFIQSTFLSSV